MKMDPTSHPVSSGAQPQYALGRSCDELNKFSMPTALTSDEATSPAAQHLGQATYDDETVQIVWWSRDRELARRDLGGCNLSFVASHAFVDGLSRRDTVAGKV
jgi:hypothetical protein